MYEAINMDGIPYEVTTDAVTKLITNNIYYRPPGNYQAADITTMDFTSNVDAVANEDGDYASKQGIVSLAFKALSLDFLDGEFKSSQDNGALTTKPSRKYGYKVYRSHDNRLTWDDLTLTSGLVQEKDYTYHPTPNTTSTEKMVFFTDYSVKIHESLTTLFPLGLKNSKEQRKNIAI